MNVPGLEAFRQAAAEAEATEPEPPPPVAPAPAPAQTPERLARAVPREDLARTWLPVLERSALGLNRPGAIVLLAQLDQELGPELGFMTEHEVLEAAVDMVARATLALSR